MIHEMMNSADYGISIGFISNVPTMRTYDHLPIHA